MRNGHRLSILEDDALSALQAALKLAVALPEAARRGADLTVVALKAATVQLQSAVTTLRDADVAL